MLGRIGRTHTIKTALLVFAAISAAKPAFAQRTFNLDRLHIPGGPEDGVGIWRPVAQPRTILFGQLALGYALNPLHTSNIISANDARTKAQSDVGVVQHQINLYGNAGVQFLNRFTVGVSWPITVFQAGSVPQYSTGNLGGPTTTAIDPDGSHANDLRLDVRGILHQSGDDKFHVGAMGALFVPTLSADYARFGSDGQASGVLGGMIDYDFGKLILTGNLGVHFRGNNSVNKPVSNAGLGVGTELRWAVGGFIPFKEGQIRLGASLFGQTGLSDNGIVGNTIFKKRNTPIEWMVEGRLRFGAKQTWWTSASVGSLFGNGYGAPDLRITMLVGSYLPLSVDDSEVQTVDAKEAQRSKWRKEREDVLRKEGTWKDSDSDGFPDETDACPNEPEDHLGDEPSDGCPKPPDRDGDGIPDSKDKCPEAAEDKDGIDDEDGCPETDADSDSIPDVQDACPKEPGQPSKEKEKNGCAQFIHLENGRIRILEQVHFATGKATILPDSFPMLQEIVNVLRVNPQIKKVTVEGHTDSKGVAEKNLKLSQSRADAVVAWLTEHGVSSSKLEGKGYGQTQPIADNKTKDGQAKNRRCEFKIVDEANQ